MYAIEKPRLERLADTLWAERRLVEYLLFKLVSAKLLLASDERRFVPAALSEVERAVEGLRAAEYERNAAVAEVASHWGVPPDHVSLRWLSDHVPPPFGPVFADHRDAFLALTDEIERTARANRKLASVALAAVNATLSAFNGAPATPTYDARGHQRSTLSPGRVNEVL